MMEDETNEHLLAEGRLPLLPDYCLAQLISKHLPSDSLLAIFQCCRPLRDMVLQHAPRGVQLSLWLLDSSLAQVLHSIQLTHQHCLKFRLSIGCTRRTETYMNGVDYDTARALAGTAWEQILSHVGKTPLVSLQELELHLLQLQGFFPPALNRAAPNLSAVKLECCAMDWDNINGDSFLGDCLSLETLHMQNMSFRGGANRCLALLQKQLCRLVHLNSLQLTAFQNQQAVIVTRTLVCGAAVHLPQRITRLVLNDASAEADLLQPGSLLEQFSCLAHLGLQRSTVCDEQLLMLLGLPSLTHVQLGAVELEGSFAKRASRWQQLTLAYASVATLARLPLSSGNMTLVLDREDLSISRDAHTADLAAVNLAKCRVIWTQPTLHVLCGTTYHAGPPPPNEQDALCRSRSLVALLPALRSVRTSLVLHGFTLSKPLALALGRHTQACRQLHGLDLIDCDWQVPAAAQLMAALPEHCTLGLQWSGHEHAHTEADITELCCAAQKPGKLTVPAPWEWLGETLLPGCGERIQAAMLLAGHQHVTLADMGPVL